MPKDESLDQSTAGGQRRESRVSAPAGAPALTIASHPRAARVGERCLLGALEAGREVALTRNEPDFVRVGSTLGAPLTDPFLSRKPIRFERGTAGSVVLHVDPGGTAVDSGEPIAGRREIT